MTSAHSGGLRISFIRLICSWILRIWSRRLPKNKRNVLLICTVCVIYVIFLAFQVAHFLPQNSSKGHHKKFKDVSTRLLITKLEQQILYLENVHPEHDALDSTTSATLRPNVVYITLKSKRIKPANIRGTVKPKKRRKYATLLKHEHSQSIIHNFNKKEKRRIPEENKVSTTIHQPSVNGIVILDDKRKDSGNYQSNIRIYSDSAPPWFSAEDIRAMRFLADCRISRIKQVQSSHGDLILFENDQTTLNRNILSSATTSVCQGKCGLIKRPLDMNEVFAFHLDRILGLNRTLPSVSRRFEFIQDGLPCPVILWDSALSPTNNKTQSSVQLNWGSYQQMLKQKCWLNGRAPKAESGCTGIHHYEWSKMALFDFLLQIYTRLDRHCCGFKPRREDLCVQQELHLKCEDPASVELTHIVQRKLDPKHLAFIDNQGFFDRSEDNLDFKLLDGIKEFPESAISVLKSHRLREKLLQSFFLDKIYWESQSGRQGIEKLIDVIERRAKILLTYINAHGVKVVPMND
ncbi:Golgi-associated kinase 1B [Bombina bombina]|uniref:Golgi-associated kinase 1B n=1 Tax=Bombina bombina TaxID=8345 RepID=UPI00235A8274|nr:Golgi-associated kinase 1B [Bombina bombina]